MTMGEFDLIERFFKRPARLADVGVGDDCAIWSPRAGYQLAFSADMLVEGRHFLSTVDPHALGHKALAVNLSDLSACGATPKAFLLSLSLPRVDEQWLSGFSNGLFHLADVHGCELIGGDTTLGPLNIAITVIGEVPAGEAILRSGAKVGDDLYVSGSLGDARLALEAFRGNISLPEAVFSIARKRMEYPTPQVALGKALRGIANSMVDVSDGLLGDLKHIVNASHVGAEIQLSSTLGLIEALSVWSCPPDLAMTCVLSGGDDYELLFSAPPSAAESVKDAALASDIHVTRIGKITDSQLIVLIDSQGQSVENRFKSFDHFS